MTILRNISSCEVLILYVMNCQKYFAMNYLSRWPPKKNFIGGSTLYHMFNFEKIMTWLFHLEVNLTLFEQIISLFSGTYLLVITDKSFKATEKCKTWQIGPTKTLVWMYYKI